MSKAPHTQETFPKVRVHSRSFFAFIVTQFLGAFNDNAFKFAIQLLVINTVLIASEQGRYISIAMGVFSLPFVLFSPFAGILADRIAKSRLVVWTKYWEVGVMLCGVGAFASGNFTLIFGVLFLMGLQSAFFSPAKYGLLPEALHNEELSYGNGLIGMTTFFAIITGTVIGAHVYAFSSGNLARGAWAFVLIAICGLASAHFIPKVAPGAPSAGRTRIFKNLKEDFLTIRGIPELRYAVVGLAYFYFLGAIFQMALILYGKNTLHLGVVHNGYFQASLAIGIGLGSYLAGRWSGEKVELGLVPFGSVMLSIFSIAFWFTPDTVPWAACMVMMLGVAGGFFSIPLNALLQQQAPPDVKGRIIAFDNIVTFIGIFFAAFMLWVCTDLLDLSPAKIILVFGIVTLFGTLFVLKLIPAYFFRFCLWLLTSIFYKIRVTGSQNIPRKGGALLVANHVSWVDAVIIAATMQRFIRFLMFRPYYEHWLFHWFFRMAHAIPVDKDDPPEKINASLQAAADELSAGEVVLIFAEGKITRTGQINPFKHGFERIMAKVPEDAKIPIIPINLGGLWGSIFSWEGGRLLFKLPKRIPYRVSVNFGDAMPAAATADQVQEAVIALDA